MKFAIRIGVFALFATLIMFLASGSAWAGFIATQITSNQVVDQFPEINDSGQIVWYGLDGNDYEIFLFDSSILQLTNNGFGDYKPQINNAGEVAWYASDGHDDEIFLYSGGVTRQLTDNAYNDWRVRINDSGQVVWFGSDGSDYEIFLYSGGSTVQMTDDAFADTNPEINAGGQVVWQGSDGVDDEIFLYSGGATVQLTDNIHADITPMLNDSGNVVWQGSDGADDEIFLYSGGVTTQLTDNITPDYLGEINAMSQVVFRAAGIFLYTPGHGTDQISASGYDPRINDRGQVVWQGSDGDGEIFVYSDGLASKVTDNIDNDSHAKINSRGELAWERGTNQTLEIYHARPSDCLPTGKPALSLSNSNPHGKGYWGSYTDYLGRVVSVDLLVTNNDTLPAYDIRITSSAASYDVGCVSSMPISIGSLQAGSSAKTTIRYSVPAGTGWFRADLFAEAEDGCAYSYSYP